jgi:hypothetical protein
MEAFDRFGSCRFLSALPFLCAPVLSAKGQGPAEYAVKIMCGTAELDVVGVYTAANAADGRVVTLEIERVPVRHAAQK